MKTRNYLLLLLLFATHSLSAQVSPNGRIKVEKFRESMAEIHATSRKTTLCWLENVFIAQTKEKNPFTLFRAEVCFVFECLMMELPSKRWVEKV